jgi:hypothetical protein
VEFGKFDRARLEPFRRKDNSFVGTDRLYFRPQSLHHLSLHAMPVVLAFNERKVIRADRRKPDRDIKLVLTIGTSNVLYPAGRSTLYVEPLLETRNPAPFDYVLPVRTRATDLRRDRLRDSIQDQKRSSS